MSAIPTAGRNKDALKQLNRRLPGAGKGDAPRPVRMTLYRYNYDLIFRKNQTAEKNLADALRKYIDFHDAGFSAQAEPNETNPK